MLHVQTRVSLNILFFFIHFIYSFFFRTMKLYKSLILYFNPLSASYFNFNLAYVPSQACIYSTSSVRFVKYIFKLTGPFILAKQYGQTICYISPHVHTREKRRRRRKKKKNAYVRTCGILFAIPQFLHYTPLFNHSATTAILPRLVVNRMCIKFPYSMCILNMET